MKKLLVNKENNLILINFDNLLSEIESECLNDLNKFGLITDYQLNLSNLDTKKVIYHHIIYGICEEIQKINNVHRKVVVIPPRITENHEIIRFCTLDDFQGFINTLMVKVQNIFPFVMYKSTEDIFGEIDMSDGNIQDMLAILSQRCEMKRNKLFTFEKIKNFAYKFDLHFLSKEYFDSIKIKMALC